MPSYESPKNLERRHLLERVRRADFFAEEGWSQPSEPLDLDSVKWTPDFVAPKGALAIITGSSVPAFLVRRLRAAHQLGIKLTVALDEAASASSDCLALLSELDVRALLFGETELSPPVSLLKFLGVEQVGVPAELRRRLISDGIRHCREAVSNHEKGFTLESLLHFMFSQVQDFKVVYCNYRTETEELDLVVRLTTINPAHWWYQMGPAFVGEAKNRASKAGQEVVSKLNSIMQGKRGACRLGFVVSLAGFTSDAAKQVLRLATEERVFVLIDGDGLEEWGQADDYDGHLSDLVGRAVLD